MILACSNDRSFLYSKDVIKTCMMQNIVDVNITALIFNQRISFESLIRVQEIF